MNESKTIPLATIGHLFLWSAVTSLLSTSWVLMMLGAYHAAVMLGVTACVLTGIATVYSVRCYCQRVCGLIRSLHGIESERSELHRVL